MEQTDTSPNIIQSILVAVDFSEPCHHALEEAARLAREQKAQLVIAHFIYDEEMAQFLHWNGIKESVLVAGRTAHIQRWVDENDAASLVRSIKVEVGHPFAELMKTIENEQPDLLVMGAQGEAHEHRENTVGSVARACLRRADCDLLLVRKDHRNPFQTVVVATDFSENSKRAVAEAAQIARADGASLHVIHVFAPAWKHYDERSETREDVDTYLAELHQKFGDFTYDELNEIENLDVTFEVLESLDATHGIIKYARKNSADLIALGTVGRSPHRLLASGSTTERVVETSLCSVLTVRPHVDSESWL